MLMADEKSTPPAKKPAPVPSTTAVTFTVERLRAEGGVILNCDRGDVAGALAGEPAGKEYTVEEAKAAVEKFRNKTIKVG